MTSEGPLTNVAARVAGKRSSELSVRAAAVRAPDGQQSCRREVLYGGTANDCG